LRLAATHIQSVILGPQQEMGFEYTTAVDLSLFFIAHVASMQWWFCVSENHLLQNQLQRRPWNQSLYGEKMVPRKTLNSSLIQFGSRAHSPWFQMS
jgi:hypothetical protein